MTKKKLFLKRPLTFHKYGAEATETIPENTAVARVRLNDYAASGYALIAEPDYVLYIGHDSPRRYCRYV